MTSEPRIEQLLEKAKLLVIRSYEHRDTTTRPWLEMHIDSYEDPSNRLAVYVLMGSPVKGLVIANYGFDTVTAIDCWGTKLKTFGIYDEVRA